MVVVLKIAPSGRFVSGNFIGQYPYYSKEAR